jgi:hypothetical protein
MWTETKAKFGTLDCLIAYCFTNSVLPPSRFL